MADGEYNPEALDEGEEGEEEQQYEASKQAVMILIEASPGMLEMAPTTAMDEDEEEEGEGGGGGNGPPRSYLRVAIQSVSQIMRWRLQHAPNDELGVIFYGAGKANIDAAFEDAYELVPLGPPSIATIHRLEELTDEQFSQQVGIAEGCDATAALRYGLWAARDKLMARTKTTKSMYRRLFIFTATEDPTLGLPKNREVLDQRLDDLHHQRTRLDVFPLPALQATFNMGLFWNHAIQVSMGRGDESEGDDDDGAGDAVLPAFVRRRDVASYLSDVMARTNATRANARLYMTFSGGLEIAVQTFSLLRASSRPPKAKVTADGFQELKASTAFLHPDGALLSDVRQRAIHFKTKSAPGRLPKAVFDDVELDVVRAPRPAGLALLGFKPASAVGPETTAGTARFVYPDEKRLKGSTAAFVALHKALLDQDKVAIGRLVMKKGNAPTLVALLPQQEMVTEDGIQVLPPGLHLLPLPWRDELRFPERGAARGVAKTAERPEATDQQVEAARALVGSLKLEADFSEALALIPNPTLARHYEVVEAIALGQRDEVPPMAADRDDTNPDPSLGEHADAAAAFSAAVYGDEGAGAPGKSVGSKRKAVPEAHTSEMYAERDWAALVGQDKLGRLTNDQLKVYLRYHSLPLSGNKAELLARITNHINATTV